MEITKELLKRYIIPSLPPAHLHNKQDLRSLRRCKRDFVCEAAQMEWDRRENYERLKRKRALKRRKVESQSEGKIRNYSPAKTSHEPGCLGLARTLAGVEPQILTPQIKLNNSRCVEELVNVVEARLHTRFEEIWLVSARDSNYGIEFTKILEWIQEANGALLSQLYFVHREKFERDKDAFVNFVEENVKEAYLRYYKAQIMGLRNRNRELEKRLTRAVAPGSKNHDDGDDGASNDEKIGHGNGHSDDNRCSNDRGHRNDKNFKQLCIGKGPKTFNNTSKDDGANTFSNFGKAGNKVDATNRDKTQENVAHHRSPTNKLAPKTRERRSTHQHRSESITTGNIISSPHRPAATQSSGDESSSLPTSTHDHSFTRSMQAPMNPPGAFGRVVGEDAAGFFYDYSGLGLHT